MPQQREGLIHRVQPKIPQFRIEKREGSELETLEGYAALFNVETDMFWWTESIAPGAFKESIERGDDVRALVDHDPSLIIGRTPKTLDLREDEKGLFATIRPSDTTAGRDITESIRRGDVSQMSFGFMIEEENYVPAGVDGREKGHFTILRARLFDVSPVTFPAYEETEIGISRAQGVSVDELTRRIERINLRTRDPEAERALRQREIELLTLMA